MSELKEIKLFLYTIEEFKRFSDYFNVRTEHSLTDGYTQDEYIATQTKLIILRKYGSKTDAVYIRKVLQMAIKEFPESADIFEQLLDEYDEIENKQLQTILADGTKINLGQSFFLWVCPPNGLGYHHLAAILDRSKNKCCGLITDGEELKNNQLCFSVDATVLHLFSDLSRTCPRTSGGWVPPLALTPKNNRSVSFLVA